jgi:hypothetical protein
MYIYKSNGLMAFSTSTKLSDLELEEVSKNMGGSLEVEEVTIAEGFKRHKAEQDRGIEARAAHAGGIGRDASEAAKQRPVEPEVTTIEKE